LLEEKGLFILIGISMSWMLMRIISLPVGNLETN
jgi:hypothetical protein